MQTPRLVQTHLVGAGRLDSVAGPRRVGEKPKSIEVRAGQRLGVDDRGAAVRAEAQGEAPVAHRVLVEAVDHGPLVQREAPQMRAAAGGRCQEVAHEGDGRRPGVEVCRDVETDPICGHLRESPRGPLGARGPLEEDADARVPSAQCRGLERVVGEEEVLASVSLPASATLAMVGRQGIDAAVVGRLARTPLRF